MERFLDYFVPEKYVLDLKIRKMEKVLEGVVTIFGEAKAKNLKFHAAGFSVDYVLVDGEKADFEQVDGVLSVFKAPSSDLGVEIGYHGSLSENMQGAYLSTYEYNGGLETIVATQFESHYAREAFPCIDEPAAKAVFELSITTPDLEDLVLANTPILEERVDSGLKTVIFEPTPRMSTYLLAWVMGRFHGKTIKNEHGVEITTYVALNQDIEAVDFANEVAARSLEFFDDNFGTPYPLPKLTQVALPDFEAGAMENWGLVTYRESMLIAGKTATLGTKKSVALVIAHELSHQWFGDLVTMEWWDDLWLNESFASVMEYFAVDKIYPEFKIFEGFFVSDCLAALKRDAYTDVQSVHQDVASPEEIATLFDSAIVYSKGARLMLMLIRTMGWEKFCQGISEYFKKFQYSNTVGDDLWASLQPFAEFDVRGLMHAFIDKPGYPVLTSTAGDFEEFSQKRFVVDGEMTAESWPIPRVLEDMSGHYVLNLSEAEFNERLLKFEELGLEEKLRLLIDRMLLSKTDLVSSASLLPLISKFKDEESAAVWDIILTIIAGLKIFFEPGSEEEMRFKKFVGELVEPGLFRLGLETQEGDDENVLRLRSILLALDYYAENKVNLEKLAGLYSADFSEMDAEIREHILDAKIYLQPEVFDEFLAAYGKTADPEIKFELLLAMTLSKDEENVSKMIPLLENLEVVKPQDQFHLFLYLFRNAAAKEKAFDWLTSHWDFVKGMAGDKSLDNYPRYMANSIRTREQAEKYREFFGPKGNDLALRRAILIGEKEIEAQLRLIERDGEAVAKALR
ncbi:MAG: M1 family metallopeptidase [Candidatus Saccharibacteria bacterium]|nr:M1 family metallopeptidase [Candidatus Saccharibacteria bacterium]